MNKKFIEKAKKVHGDKYDYSLVEYINSNTKVRIICKVHGIFNMYPGHHINRKSNCPKCSKRHNYNTDEFIEKAKKVHGDKYDYSLTKYINNKTKVKIICPEHGIFEQRPDDHLKGKKCYKCSNVYNYDTDKFIEKAKKVHGDKYDYSLVKYKNNRTKIIIICPEHGEFLQNPNDHLNKHGCPKCNESKGEKEIRKELEKYNVEFQKQKTFKKCKYKQKLQFDFYLPEYNICIEYDGKQHFEPIDYFGGIEYYKELKIKDKIKNNYCKDNNINLLRISYKDDINFLINKLINENKL